MSQQIFEAHERSLQLYATTTRNSIAPPLQAASAAQATRCWFGGKLLWAQGIQLADFLVGTWTAWTSDFLNFFKVPTSSRLLLSGSDGIHPSGISRATQTLLYSTRSFECLTSLGGLLGTDNKSISDFSSNIRFPFYCCCIGFGTSKRDETPPLLPPPPPP